LCCKILGKNDDAYEAFFKATWSAAWQDAAYLSLAQADTAKGEYAQALDNVERSLVRNWHNHKARQLKASILRKLDRKEEALAWIGESLEIDHFNIGCHFEKYLISNDAAVLSELTVFMRGWAHNYLEYALDFSTAGLYEEAIELLMVYVQNTESVYPTILYAIGYFNSRSGDEATAASYYTLAEKCLPDYCFPNRYEEILILQDAVRLNPEGAKAYYFLGNFWYSKQQYDQAVTAWEKSAELDSKFPTVWRNLSLAYFNQRNEKQRAVSALEKAFALDESDSRILMELDQLYKKMGRSHTERFDFLTRYMELVNNRDDLSIEYIQLYNQLDEFGKAKTLMDARIFHPWEGGEGKITGQYTFCRVELAKRAIAEKRFQDALTLLLETDAYPHNLGEGKLPNTEENDVDYYKGIAYEGLGETDKAKAFFQKATIGSSEPQIAFFYNDSQPDKIFYQGLAWNVLGMEQKAETCFKNLINHGEEHMNDNCRIDYFAVSLPDLAIWDENLNVRNRIHCNYVMGLGLLGLGDKKNASGYFTEVLALDINHQGAQVHLKMCHSHQPVLINEK